MKQLRVLNKQCFHLTFIIGIIWLFSSCSPKPTVDKLRNDIINTLTNGIDKIDVYEHFTEHIVSSHHSIYAHIFAINNINLTSS